MIEVTETKNIVGRSSGSVTENRIRTGPAPSIRAASYTWAGICCSPARKNSETYPTDDHTCTNTTDPSAVSGEVSHSTRCPRIAFTAPLEGSSRHFHTTPSASGAHTHDRTHSTRRAFVTGSPRFIAIASSSPNAYVAGN